MATPKPQIRSMFPTPVCVHFLPVAQEVNTELRPLVLEKMNGGDSADPHGWRSGADLESWGGLPVQTLFRMLRELADSMTGTRSGGRVTLNWRIAAFAGVRLKGQDADCHMQDDAVWSGVYFVDDGYGKSDDERLGGECAFADPRGTLTASVAPQYGFRIPGGATVGQWETIRPQTGMILLHPSWQPRGEHRYDGNGQRITIEFDLSLPE
ncbi:MAG TPA: putative 2OG-Fe(II) oxygenase [Rhizomicrobium sp.]|jgi:hypothetical protein